jgi:hypothetical protein
MPDHICPNCGLRFYVTIARSPRAGSYKFEAEAARKSALDRYWDAKSPAEERAALKEFYDAGGVLSGAEPPARPVEPSRAAWDPSRLASCNPMPRSTYRDFWTGKQPDLPPLKRHKRGDGYCADGDAAEVARPRDEEWAVR